MKWHELAQTHCPIARTLSIFGDRWTLLIIRNAFLRTQRFDDFQQQLGITRHLLAERLNRLVDCHVFEKVLYNQSPKRYEYKLTPKGKALYPIIIAMSDWGNTWQNEDNEFLSINYLHKKCGNITKPSVTCDCCGEELEANQVLPVFQEAE
ncbi:winged helix-turn-helix transcriptional regulator [Acinetobacter defluvii]|uniref:winged helix-turn-helix transcriptional regulator n=1 Tax=Acinetobacter defluvii TaxID=1871111 RepID=UPI003AF481E2